MGLGGPVARTVTYRPLLGLEVAVRAFASRRDSTGQIGDRTVGQDVMTFTFRRSDLPADPVEGDRVIDRGTTWIVTGWPEGEALGDTFTVRAAADDAP